ncbi:MAG: 3-phosphoserine/phosphohydroxythreonine transaminase [Pseudomonadales bacterium]|nr:3-phosphoserine/phosphohydroxythreonine transaminase [Pseudomonadales bacterium]MCP5358699.1 3-phosphoserine/phosphohydroxythreonine transaminase [Pseudomonadales bacterium]
MKRVFNFGAGPAMLPTSVMEKARDEFLDYKGLGAGLIEISHRSKEFDAVIDRTDALFRELSGLPDNYRILYVHGGAQMQFSAIPMNLIGLNPAHKAAYVETGNFASIARKEAQRYGKITVAATSESTNFDRIPAFDPATLDADTSYVHITGNNTIFGTRWNQFPDTGKIPLVADMTSELLSRKLDYNQFGAIFAGLQKNLGPAGLAVVLIREDLLGHALPYTPALLDYAVYDKSHSLQNTNNTFAIYMMCLVLEWLKEQGGVDVIEARNEQKAKLIYDAIDGSDFYIGSAQQADRSIMNVTFNLAKPELSDTFLSEANKQGLYALKGHRLVGGIRASIYNAMPVEGCEALVAFMKDFEKRNG